MEIIQINHKDNNSNAIIKLNDKEIREILSGLLVLTKDTGHIKDKNFYELYRCLYLLYEVVKNGDIDNCTMTVLNNIQNKIIEKS